MTAAWTDAQFAKQRAQEEIAAELDALRERALPEVVVEAWRRCDEALRHEVLTTLRAQRSRPELAAVEDRAADLLQSLSVSSALAGSPGQDP
jgi:hypothetical protein